jgi:hypothetical protein
VSIADEIINDHRPVPSATDLLRRPGTVAYNYSRPLPIGVAGAKSQADLHGYLIEGAAWDLRAFRRRAFELPYPLLHDTLEVFVETMKTRPRFDLFLLGCNPAFIPLMTIWPKLDVHQRTAGAWQLEREWKAFWGT